MTMVGDRFNPQEKAAAEFTEQTVRHNRAVDGARQGLDQASASFLADDAYAQQGADDLPWHQIRTWDGWRPS